jgi:uncharacterized membrane protein YfcA
MIEIDGMFLLACLVVLLAATVSGLAGFGLAIISIPPLLFIYEPPTVIALIKVLTLGTTWIIVADAWRDISWRWIARIAPTALIGLFIGSWLLRVLDADAIKVIAGAVVFVLALALLTWQPHAVRERGWMAPALGLVSGTGSTAVGLSGPPVVLFFTVMRVGKETLRATIAMYFVVLDLIGLPTLVAQGSVDGDDLRLALAIAPVAVVGRLVGIRLVRFVSPLAFRRVTLGLLLVTGATSVITGLAGLGR